MKRIILHIDRLVLNGFPADDRDAIAAGLQTELGRLLAEPAMAERLGTLGNVARVRTDPARVAPSAPPEISGTAVARAIVNGVSR
jgi:hypothetical protein